MRRLGTRGELWQMLDPATAEPEVVRVAERLLDLATGNPVLDGMFDLGSPAVRRFLERHRVASLVPPDLVDDDSRKWLRSRQREIAAAQLRLRSVAARCLDLLAAADIETRVLKGLATAELDYPTRLARHTGDVDLAIHPDQLDEAVVVLTRHGRRDHPTPFDPVLLYGWTLDSPEGVEIDLHARLFRRSPLGVSLLNEPGVPLTSIPGVAMPAEHRLVHAAGHFMISPPGTRRMNGFLDITRLLDRPDLDLDCARRFAAALGVEPLVGAGVQIEAELSGRRDVVDAIGRWKPPDWLERQTRLVARRRLVLDHLGRYREVPSGHRWEYLPAWLLPTARQRRLLAASATVATARAVDRVRARATRKPSRSRDRSTT